MIPEADVKSDIIFPRTDFRDQPERLYSVPGLWESLSENVLVAVRQAKWNVAFCRHSFLLPSCVVETVTTLENWQAVRVGEGPFGLGGFCFNYRIVRQFHLLRVMPFRVRGWIRCVCVGFTILFLCLWLSRMNIHWVSFGKTLIECVAFLSSGL